MVIICPRCFSEIDVEEPLDDSRMMCQEGKYCDDCKGLDEKRGNICGGSCSAEYGDGQGLGDSTTKREVTLADYRAKISYEKLA
jgi:hypothetical protein